MSATADPPVGARRANVLMLAYGDEPYLHDAIAAVLASLDVRIDLTLVDNGCTSDAVRTLPADDRLHVLTPEANLGFTGGMNLAARHSEPGPLVLVNSDALVAPDAIGLLLAALDDPQVGIAGALIALADRTGTVNSAGNPLHVLGLSWAGGLGEPVEAHATGGPRASVSGACLAVDRELWEELGGLPPDFFAYMEDLELCWRTWQRGRTVLLVPEAVALHHYEFGRSPLKMYLLERNRLMLVLTTYGRRSLAVLALPLVAFDLALLVVAVAQGWGRQKLSGWAWLLRNPGVVARRRRLVQSGRRVPDRELTWLMTDRFDSAQLPLPAAAAPLEGLLRAWWRLARRWV